MTLTKADACALLHISSTTLWRRIKAGQYTCTRTGEGQFASLTFTHADLGLDAGKSSPSMAGTAGLSPALAMRGGIPPEPLRVPEPDISEPDAFAPHESTDSWGHTITGNDHHRAFASQPPAKPSGTDSHMPEGLRNKVTGGDAASDDHPINAMMIRAGLMKPAERPMTETQRRQFVNRAAWAEGMAKGYSR